MIKINEEIIASSLCISGVYLIRNTEEDICYIGQARNILKRWFDHMTVTSNVKLAKDIREKGLNIFTFSILEIVDDTTELFKREKYYINLYAVIKNKKLYNNITYKQRLAVQRNLLSSRKIVKNLEKIPTEYFN